MSLRKGFGYGKVVFSALCPVGYTAPHGSSCYKFVTARADWFEALYSCLRAEARLVAIETAEEDAYLRGYIKSHFATNMCKLYYIIIQLFLIIIAKYAFKHG